MPLLSSFGKILLCEDINLLFIMSKFNFSNHKYQYFKLTLKARTEIHQILLVIVFQWKISIKRLRQQSFNLGESQP